MIADRDGLIASDGYRLTTTRFAGSLPSHSTLIVAGATGVPQGFYRRFAEFAARQGYETYTLDYRGIGLSAPASLRGFRMDYRDWARLDIAAAIEEYIRPDRPMFLVGHSYGLVGLGLLPNHDRLTAAYGFGAGSGWHGWMPASERPRVLALWHIIAPPLVAAFGYLPWSRILPGEDLPTDVYRQWKRWTGYRRFLLDDPLLEDIRDQYAAVKTPMVAANSIDDRWAPPRSRDALMSGYTTAHWEGIDIDPHSLGLRTIGHSGYFRESARPLWDEVIERFDEIRRA